MALLGDFGEDYTKTGHGGMTGISNKLSFLPFVRNWKIFSFLDKVPIIGGIFKGSVTAVFGFIDTIIESGGWLLRGKVGSALTVAAAGTVSTAVNSLEATPFWWVNAASGVTTGKSLGTHARAVTEGLIGSVTGAMGVKPQVLQSYPAGIGSISSGASVSQPGRFASQISAERGRNAQDDYSNYMNGEGGVHVNELGSAYGRGAA